SHLGPPSCTYPQPAVCRRSTHTYTPARPMYRWFCWEYLATWRLPGCIARHPGTVLRPRAKYPDHAVLDSWLDSNTVSLLPAGSDVSMHARSAVRYAP